MTKPKKRYTAFVDPSSGAIAIAHLEGDRVVFDALVDPSSGAVTDVPKSGASVKHKRRRRGTVRRG